MCKRVCYVSGGRARLMQVLGIGVGSLRILTPALPPAHDHLARVGEGRVLAGFNKQTVMPHGPAGRLGCLKVAPPLGERRCSNGGEEEGEEQECGEHTA